MSAVFAMRVFAALAGATCSSRVELRGDAPELMELASTLERRGIHLGGGPDCAPVVIDVDTRSGQLALRIGLEGRALERSADEVAEAATIIESWVRADLTSPLIERTAPPRTRRTVYVPQAIERPAGAAAAEPAPRPGRDLVLVGLGGVFGVGSDGSAWSGVDARACFHLAWMCLGGRVQYAIDVGTGGFAAELDTQRNLLDLTATAEVPLALGALEVVPGLGIGQGTSSAHQGSEATEEDAAGLRLRAQLGADYRLYKPLAVRMEAALDYAPFARREIVGGLDEGHAVRLPGEVKWIAWLRLSIELGGF